MHSTLVEPHVTAATAAPAPGALVLDDLLDTNEHALARLYADARVPQLDALDGDLRGRVLAVRKLPRWLGSLARVWAASDWFPWRGKSFAAQAGEQGEGKNRIVLDRWRVFRFETTVAKSRAGDFDAVQLNYDLPENPFFIRPIKDEIRQVGDGLFLGQAYWATRKDTHLVLYFGLTQRS